MMLKKNNGNMLLFYLVLLLSGYAFVCSGRLGESKQERLVEWGSSLPSTMFFLALAKKQCKTFGWITEPSWVGYLFRKKCKASSEEWSRSGRDGHVAGCRPWLHTGSVPFTLATHQQQFIVPVFCPFFIHFPSLLPPKDIPGRIPRLSEVRFLKSFAARREVVVGTTLL